MDTSKKTQVNVRIEQQGTAQTTPGAPDDATQGNGVIGAAKHAQSAAAAWLNRTAPGHVNAVIFGFFGLAVALIILYVGFFQALLVAFLVLLGVAFGQWLDGDPKIVNGIRRLLTSTKDS